jgi:signal transduction histidine kinase
MDLTYLQCILVDRRIAYAVTDRQLQVMEVGGDLAVLGWDLAPWMGRSLLDLVPELLGSELVVSDVLSGALPRFELAWINREMPDGETRYLTMVCLPYRDEEGQIAGLTYLVQDATEAGVLGQQLSQNRNELHLAQDRLARQNLDLAAANAELRRLDDLKSTFVSVAAHELVSPLTVIRGYVEMLTSVDVHPLSAQQREYLKIVEENTSRILQTTSSLLDVSRIETGQLELRLQPVNLPAVVRQVMMDFEPEVAAKGLHLTLSEAPDLPLALCDPTRAMQIVGNLLSNAVKYTPRGGQVHINVGLASAEGFLKLSVADDGVGIGPKDQDKVFRRFFRASSALELGASGSGLGLYITQSLVELHGGRIWFRSTPGKGSTFYVTFLIAG